MNKFLLKISAYAILIFASIYVIFLQADGSTDPFYKRFTTPKQSSFIIGTSRAAQGLQPQIFKEYLSKDVYNFSFTIVDSPYGPVYLNSIQQKLKENSKNGLFVVTVDPWSISSNSQNPNDSSSFKELNRCLGKTKILDMNPNIPYLVDNLKGRYTQIFKKNKNMFLHFNGWLEVTLSMDSTSTKKRLESKLKDYRERNLRNFNFSRVRFDYLKKTIQYLKQHGTVIIVRLPVHPKMSEIDNLLIPDFNNKIICVSEEFDVSYYDMSNMNADFYYTDGNHLHKESGKEVSRLISMWILKNAKGDKSFPNKCIKNLSLAKC